MEHKEQNTQISKEFRTTNVPQSKPYMGNLTSQQIGNMARAGMLGGEMVRRMVIQQEHELINQYENHNGLK